jgi:hypothetical protein
VSRAEQKERCDAYTILKKDAHWAADHGSPAFQNALETLMVGPIGSKMPDNLVLDFETEVVSLTDPTMESEIWKERLHAFKSLLALSVTRS